MKDKKLREFLKVGQDYYGELASGWLLESIADEGSAVHEKLKVLLDMVVNDYFYECPIFQGRKYILRDTAESFQELIYDRFGIQIETFYTTKENYKTHKSSIEAMEERVASYKKLK